MTQLPIDNHGGSPVGSVNANYLLIVT